MTDTIAAIISYEELGHKGRFIAKVDGVDSEAALSISKVSDLLVIADSTFVPEAMRGMGAAGALVNALIADARAKGYRIMPLCPFVQAQSLRHPEWSDVVQH